jgi:hypothetical protein
LSKNSPSRIFLLFHHLLRLFSIFFANIHPYCLKFFSGNFLCSFALKSSQRRKFFTPEDVCRFSSLSLIGSKLTSRWSSDGRRSSPIIQPGAITSVACILIFDNVEFGQLRKLRNLSETRSWGSCRQIIAAWTRHHVFTVNYSRMICFSFINHPFTILINKINEVKAQIKSIYLHILAEKAHVEMFLGLPQLWFGTLET